MNSNTDRVLGSLEGRSFIIGREGHIYIDDLNVSKEHAELKIIEGRVRIRDLDSTNGIFVVKNEEEVRFKDDYVELHQTISIAGQKRTVRKLLAIIGVFAD